MHPCEPGATADSKNSIPTLLTTISGLKTRKVDPLHVMTSYTGTRGTAPYLLTPWSIVLLEKLIGFQLVKKFPAFYGTLMFITAVTSARLLSLS